MFRFLLCLVLVFTQSLCLYAWNGDGFFLPFRGQRVGARCANGQCVFNGPRRSRAAASYSHSSGYSSGYGSHGQTSYSSGGSSGTYGGIYYSVPNTSYRSGGSSGSYGGYANPNVGYGSYGNTSYQTPAVDSQESKKQTEEFIETLGPTVKVNKFQQELKLAERSEFQKNLLLAKRADANSTFLALR